MATIWRKRRGFTPEERREYVERFERSGLTQAEFCRRVNVHPVTFSQWRHRAKPATAFAEVQVSGPTSVVSVTAGAAILHLPGGARLEVALSGDAWRGLGVMLQSLQPDHRP